MFIPKSISPCEISRSLGRPSPRPISAPATSLSASTTSLSAAATLVLASATFGITTSTAFGVSTSTSTRLGSYFSASCCSSPEMEVNKTKAV